MSLDVILLLWHKNQFPHHISVSFIIFLILIIITIWSVTNFIIFFFLLVKYVDQYFSKRIATRSVPEMVVLEALPKYQFGIRICGLLHPFVLYHCLLSRNFIFFILITICCCILHQFAFVNRCFVIVTALTPTRGIILSLIQHHQLYFQCNVLYPIQVMQHMYTNFVFDLRLYALKVPSHILTFTLLQVIPLYQPHKFCSMVID